MTKGDVYLSVTERMIEALEAGTVPWRVPWIGGGPISIRNSRSYRGINVFLLELMSQLKGYGDPRWGTYKAIGEAGGQVREGEKATWVLLWKPVARKATAEQIAKGEDPGRYLLGRSYPVFNADQADGLPEYVDPFEHEPIERAEEIVRSYVPNGPLIQFGGGSAHYQPARDLVACPAIGQFERAEGFYSTLFHELVHSTGHESRLKRIESTTFGTDPYSKEELVAEMGAAMLCGLARIDNLDQSAAYMSGWLTRLREDAKLVVQAAAQAQKAADLIVGDLSPVSEEEPALAAA